MFEWDEAKDTANVRKHGVTFALASEIFAGRVRTYVDSRFDYGEVRKIGVGVTTEGVYLTVVFTTRTDNTRIISARRSNRAERQRYDEEIRKAFDG